LTPEEFAKTQKEKLKKLLKRNYNCWRSKTKINEKKTKEETEKVKVPKSETGKKTNKKETEKPELKIEVPKQEAETETKKRENKTTTLSEPELATGSKLKVVGKIDLESINSKTKPDKKSKAGKEKERKKKKEEEIEKRR